MRQMVGLEDLGQGLAFGGDAEPRRRLPRRRRLVAQGFPPAPNTMVREGGAEKHRHDLRTFQSAGQVLVDLFFWGLYVLEKLIEQRVVEIGQLLDQTGAGGSL